MGILILYLQQKQFLLPWTRGWAKATSWNFELPSKYFSKCTRVLCCWLHQLFSRGESSQQLRESMIPQFIWRACWPLACDDYTYDIMLPMSCFSINRQGKLGTDRIQKEYFCIRVITMCFICSLSLNFYLLSFRFCSTFKIVCMYAHMCTHHTSMCLWMSEKGIGVACGCEPPNMGTENETQVLYKSSEHSKPLICFYSLLSFLFCKHKFSLHLHCILALFLLVFYLPIITEAAIIHILGG